MYHPFNIPRYAAQSEATSVTNGTGKIKEAYDKSPALPNLLLDPFFKGKMEAAQAGWRSVVALAIMSGIPVPAMSTALSYYDGYRCERLPANLLQAQRDFFGAHTYERIDKPRGQFFHTNWTGHGGSTTSSTYEYHSAKL